MCLYTTIPAKIAEKPIIVYKVLYLYRILLSGDEIYRTPCQGTSVMINDTLKAVVNTEPTETCINNKSFFVIEGEGVHAYTSKKNAKKHSYTFYTITKWEIPAGAKYWLGTDPYSKGEIAATEMKFIKVCKL